MLDLSDAALVQHHIAQLQQQLVDAHAEIARLREACLTDPLTRLYNRRYLDATLPRELHHAARTGTALSLVLLDVDHFKAINDTYGHPVGDAVLQALAELLQQRMRRSDCVCRYGGEEMAIILPQTDPTTAAIIAMDVCTAVRGLSIVVAETTITITASFGIASYPHHEAEATRLLAQADAALYRAKQQGRNQVVLADAADEAAA